MYFRLDGKNIHELASMSIADELIPAFKPSFARADEVSAHVFPYDPI